MTKRRSMLVATISICMLPFVMGPACQDFDPDLPGGIADDTDLTSIEKHAIVTAAYAPATIAKASRVAQDVSGGLDDDSGLMRTKRTFGTCPEVTIEDVDQEFTDSNGFFDDFDDFDDFGEFDDYDALADLAGLGGIDDLEDLQGLLGSMTTAAMIDEIDGEELLDFISSNGLDISTNGDGIGVVVDFGEEPCTVYTNTNGDAYVCAGLASGHVSLSPTSLYLEFEELTCNEETLNGTVDLTFAWTNPGVELEGDWYLDYWNDYDSYGTEGFGVASYTPVIDGCCDVTSIEEFEGVLYDGDYEWESTMADLLIAFEKYDSFIPYAGVVTMDGPDIRQITITFNENSPVTGEVEISIAMGRTITVELWDLLDSLESPED